MEPKLSVTARVPKIQNGGIVLLITISFVGTCAGTASEEVLTKLRGIGVPTVNSSSIQWLLLQSQEFATRAHAYTITYPFPSSKSAVIGIIPVVVLVIQLLVMFPCKEISFQAPVFL